MVTAEIEQEVEIFERILRTRRTHKAFDPQPVEPEILDELFELARWAPNHNLTNPWRFRVLGPDSRNALKQATDPVSAAKLDRAPTLVVASVEQTEEDKIRDQEDLAAAACATYILLLGAHARGLAGYWRTPDALRTEAGREACQVNENETILGLIHLGYGKAADKEPPVREGIESIRSYLP